MDKLDTADLTGCDTNVQGMRVARRMYGEFAIQILTFLSGNDYCTVRGNAHKKATQIVFCVFRSVEPTPLDDTGF